MYLWVCMQVGRQACMNMQVCMQVCIGRQVYICLPFHLICILVLPERGLCNILCLSVSCPWRVRGALPSVSWSVLPQSMTIACSWIQPQQMNGFLSLPSFSVHPFFLFLFLSLPPPAHALMRFSFRELNSSERDRLAGTTGIMGLQIGRNNTSLLLTPASLCCCLQIDSLQIDSCSISH